MSRPPLLLATALLILWSASASAQTDPTPPPQAVQSEAPASAPASNFPALPLGHDGIRDVQSQLTALGFDPGPADGEAGPATLAATQQYNENRGGSEEQGMAGHDERTAEGTAGFPITRSCCGPGTATG